MVLINELMENNERVWILNTIINDNRGHFKKRQGMVREFLDKNEDNVVYLLCYLLDLVNSQVDCIEEISYSLKKVLKP